MDELTLRDAMYELLNDEVKDKDSFCINSVESLTWYTGHIERLFGHIKRQRMIADKKMEALKRAYEAEAEKIEGDFLRETAEFRNSIRTLRFKYAAQANNFAKSHIETLKSRSFNVGQFRFGFRKKASTLRVTNRENAIEWLYRNGLDQVVRVEESIDMSELNSRFKTADTLPEGISKTPEEDIFYIRLADSDMTEQLTGEPNSETDGDNIQ